jgi:5'(3')-deoxyribonucleotidase
MNRQTIIIDVDDTFLQSSQEIIRQLNLKNNTNKTIDDLKDYGYKSIDKNVTQKDILKMYGSQLFFDKVKLTKDSAFYISILQDKYNILFVSYGDIYNLQLKEKFLHKLFKLYNWKNVEFEGVLFEETKSKIQRDVLFAIDNHSEHLKEYNAKHKILFKNYQNVIWNQCPPNSEWYTANNFKEIYDIIKYIDI